MQSWGLVKPQTIALAYALLTTKIKARNFIFKQKKKWAKNTVHITWYAAMGNDELSRRSLMISK